MRLAFGIPSAFVAPQAIDQFCLAVGQRHAVIVHHDYSKQAQFALSSSNAHVIKDPVVTDWGGWGFIQAIMKIMRRAYESVEFDYFQLMSDSCLPIKPIA